MPRAGFWARRAGPPEVRWLDRPPRLLALGFSPKTPPPSARPWDLLTLGVSPPGAEPPRPGPRVLCESLLMKCSQETETVLVGGSVPRPEPREEVGEGPPVHRPASQPGGNPERAAVFRQMWVGRKWGHL